MGTAWLGLTKQEDTCDADADECQVKGWQWQDGSAYQFPNWHDWRGDFEPSKTYLGLCGYLRSSEGIHALTCNSYMRSICEKGMF